MRSERANHDRRDEGEGDAKHQDAQGNCRSHGSALAGLEWQEPTMAQAANEQITSGSQRPCEQTVPHNIAGRECAFDRAAQGLV
jgi:hypothetical protein